MAGIRGKDTQPELALRRALHRRGLRYRLHDRKLPGRPDLVFPARDAVVLVNGCFWHAHAGCRYFKLPSTRQAFWEEKLMANRERDRRNLLMLEQAGWRVAVVWECSMRLDLEATVEGVDDWLRASAPSVEFSWPTA